jgi:carbon monoxide dehydrogenase subunit G
VIEIDEEIAVPAPPEHVWQVISDPAEVVSCLQGAELGAAHDDGSFDGSLVVRFSAVRVRFGARVALDLDEAERQGRLSARGRDGQGATRFNAHANFRLSEDHAAGVTRVQVVGNVTLAGKLASLIEAGAGAVIARMTRDFTDELARRCADHTTPTAAVQMAVMTATPLPSRPSPTSPVSPPAAAGSRDAAVRRSPWSRVRAWWLRITHKRAIEESGVPGGTAE